MAVCGIGEQLLISMRQQSLGKPNKKACDLPASVGEGPFKVSYWLVKKRDFRFHVSFLTAKHNDASCSIILERTVTTIDFSRNTNVSDCA